MFGAARRKASTATGVGATRRKEGGAGSVGIAEG